MDLITRNMKPMYEQSNWGWNEANKKKEMLDEVTTLQNFFLPS